MKILHLSYTDAKGGAAKACYRTHQALRRAGYDSEILTCLPPRHVEDSSVRSYCDTLLKQAWRKLLKVGTLATVRLLQQTTNQNLHTLQRFSIVSAKYLNACDADVISLHWVYFEMLGIREIKKIKKPILWTLHDMWPFMGTEHYDDLEHPKRYVAGYTRQNNENVRGIDFNRQMFEAKRKHWKDVEMTIIAPSRWMKNCVEESALLGHQRVVQIPYTLPPEIFYPREKAAMRKKLNLPLDKKIVAFGAFDIRSHIKGGDLLHEALPKIKREDVEFVVFGLGDSQDIAGIKTHGMGFVHDEQKLADIYSAADVTVVPSRQDNLPNLVLESIACGTPVVAFDIGGMPDMIQHKYNGYLAEAFDTDDLAKGIAEVLDATADLSAQSRAYFEANFSVERLLENFQTHFPAYFSKK